MSLKRSLVSIIVPVYNASKFIDKCINSILNQSYKHLELLLINDGSKDNSLEILKKYEKSNKKIIKVFSHDNRGVAFTKNRGIDLAKGDYITFVDSDDYVDSDYIESLLNGIGNNDIIVSGYKKFNDKKVLFDLKPRKNDIFYIYKYSATLGKLYKASFIKDNKIYYPINYQIGEDMFFTMDALSKTNKIVSIPYSGYNYYENLNSLTNSVSNKKKFMNMFSLLEDINNNIKSSEYVDYRLLYLFYFKAIILNVLMLRKVLSYKELFFEYSKSMKWLEVNNLNTIGKKLPFCFQKLEEKRIIFICNVFALFRKLRIDKLLIRLLSI